MAKVLAWDRSGRVRPVSIEGVEGDRLLEGMDPGERMDSWHLVTEGGDRHSAGAAVAPLMALLPGGRPLAALAARFPRATERAYRWVADHRSPLGRLLSAGALGRADRRIEARGGQASSE